MSVPAIRRLTDTERAEVVGIGFVTAHGSAGYVSGLPERPLAVGQVLADDIQVAMTGAGCLTSRVFYLRAGDRIDELA